MPNATSVAHTSAVVFGMEWKDIIMTIAVIVGPLATWYISRISEMRRDLKSRRFSVFLSAVDV